MIKVPFISFYYYRTKPSEILSTSYLGIEADKELEKHEKEIVDFICEKYIKTKKDLNKKEVYYVQCSLDWLESKHEGKNFEMTSFEIIKNFKQLEKEFQKVLNKE